MDLYWSLLLLFLLFNKTVGNFINFKNGYEYTYHFTSDSTIKELDNFQTDAKISFTAIEKTSKYQEVLLKIYSFSFQSAEHKDRRSNGEGLDFSEWFSFEITPYGEILRVYHPPEENTDVLMVKKGFAALLASKLHNQENVDNWSYSTKEFGNEGHHNATYTVVKTSTGIEFKKVRQIIPIPNAKGNHMKTLHYNHDLGTIHSVIIEEDVTSPQMAPDFDPYQNIRKFKAVNEFRTMEYPEMSATNKGELKFLTRQVVTEREYRPLEEIVNGSIHTPNYKMRENRGMSLSKMRESIQDSVKCIRQEPEQGSTLVLSCFHALIQMMKDLPDEELEDLAGHYFKQMKPISKQNKESTEVMIDAFAVLSTDDSQKILTRMIIRSSQPHQDFITRLMTHVSGYDIPPHQSIINGMEDLCFHRDKFPESLYTGDLYNRVLLALGSVVHKLSKAGDKNQATAIIDKVHSMLGLHDPWVYRIKRAVQTDSEKLQYDHRRVVLLETLGNARMDSSYDIIISHINTTNSPWIKRSGVHALRKYEHQMAANAMLKAALYDEDENVRYDALLLYQEHPKSKVITPLNKRSINNETGITDPYESDIDVQVHERSRRGFWEGLKYKLKAPGVNWQKRIGGSALGASFGVIMENYLDLLISPLSSHFKVAVHDEAYALAHVGIVGMNLEFFVARICYKGETSYNINIFQEGDSKQALKNALRFDKVIKNIVGGVKKGIDLFMDILTGKFSIKDIVKRLITALKELPRKVAELRSRAINAMKVIGKFDETQLPPFIRPFKNLILKVQTLFNDIKTDVMTFYNKLEELIEVRLPVMADRIFKSVKDVIEGFGMLAKSPKSALVKLGLGVFQIYMSYTEALKLKNETQEACFFLKDEKPYWWDIKSEYIKIESLVMKAKDSMINGGREWVNDVKEDTVAEFTKGKYTMAQVRQEVIDEITALMDDLLNPFSLLDGLADPFVNAYEATFGVIKSVKEAYNFLKEGFETAKSVLNSIFGSKVPEDFPRKTRQDTNGCRGKGYYPARFINGEKEYWSEGVDLEISVGQRVVAPFSGHVMLSDRPNEVIIKATGGSLKDIDVYITNVQPIDTILHPTDDNYIENLISAGVEIGTATRSPCENHIHFAMKRNGGFIDPTRFLQSRIFHFQPYYEACNDYKLVWKMEVKAVGFVVDHGGKGEEDTTPSMPNSDGVSPENPPPSTADPGEEIQTVKQNPNGMFSKVKNIFSQSPGSSKPLIQSGIKDMFSTLLKKADSFFKRFSLKRLKLGSIIEFLDKLGMTDSKKKLAEVLKSIKKLIDNKPCLNPAQASDEQLKQELLERGKLTSGTREQMITRLTTPDNRCPWMSITTPNNMFCTYDSMCLGLECCMNVKFLMFLYTIKAYARYDPCQYEFKFGIKDKHYTLKFDMGYDGLSDEIYTGLKFNVMGGIEAILKYDIQKTDTGLVASIKLGLCEREDSSNCLAEFSLLANAVLPLPICKTDGTIVWPQDCKSVVPVDVVFVVDESGSVGDVHFKKTMTALSNTVDKMAIGKNFVHVGVTFFAGTKTSRTLLQLNSQYDTPTIKKTFSDAVYKKGSHTDIADAFRYACEEVFVSHKGDRSDAQNYLVLLTDGKSNYGSNPVKVQAAACKNAGVRIVTVGIGSGIDEPLLKEVAYSLPNYYLHTVYDDLHKTLPQLVIETMDCSSVWNMEVDYAAYLNLDSIKSRIKEAAIKKLEEKKEELKEKLLEALGLPKEIFRTTGTCNRPDKMSDFQLKSEIEARGLDRSGSNTQLIERLEADDRRCEMMGKELYLPEITNSWLKDRVYYYISNDCLRLDACVDVSFNLGDFKYAKSFSTFVELDFCKYMLKFGFEGKTRSLILISYNWGKQETLTITKNVQIMLTIDKDDTKKVFKIDFGLKLCFQGSCVIDQMFLEDHEIPIPICNENFTFSGESISDVVKAIGGKMTEDVFDIVLRHLGLDKHLTQGACEVPVGPVDCPLTINPQKYLPASVRTMLQCEMVENCLGLHCCIDLSFKLPLGDKTVSYNIPFWIKFDPCQFEIDIAFGGYRYKRRILNYDWGEKNVISIGKGEPAPIAIEYYVDQMANGKGFIVDVNIKICLPH